MKPKSFLLSLLGAAVLVGVATAPRSSSGQAADDEGRAVERLVNEIAAQQVEIINNQARIDAKVAAITEEVRQARIYAGRGGGKAQ